MALTLWRAIWESEGRSLHIPVSRGPAVSGVSLHPLKALLGLGSSSACCSMVSAHDCLNDDDLLFSKLLSNMQGPFADRSSPFTSVSY